MSSTLKYAVARAKRQTDEASLNTALKRIFDEATSALEPQSGGLLSSSPVRGFPRGWPQTMKTSLTDFSKTLAAQFGGSLLPSEMLQSSHSVGAAHFVGEDGSFLPTIQLMSNLQKVERGTGRLVRSANVYSAATYREDSWQSACPSICDLSEVTDESHEKRVAMESKRTQLFWQAWREYIANEQTKGMCTEDPNLLPTLIDHTPEIIRMFGLPADSDDCIEFGVTYDDTSASKDPSSNYYRMVATALSRERQTAADGSAGLGDARVAGAVHIHVTTDQSGECTAAELSSTSVLGAWRRSS